MAATVSSLRGILLGVEPPKLLIDRKSELPILPEDLLRRLKKATTREEGIRIAEDAKKIMEPEADEVYPSIFIGNYKAVNTVSFLKSLAISHIFNAAEGDGPGMVPALDPANLEGIEYKALMIKDNIDAKDDGSQVKLFLEAADMIKEMLKEDNSKVIVNCFSGLSRSSCCVLAYLIQHEGLTAGEALTALKQKRDVWPSNENLAHIARISNDRHGFDVDNVVDVDDGVQQFRLISRKK